MIAVPFLVGIPRIPWRDVEWVLKSSELSWIQSISSRTRSNGLQHITLRVWLHDIPCFDLPPSAHHHSFLSLVHFVCPYIISYPLISPLWLYICILRPKIASLGRIGGQDAAHDTAYRVLTIARCDLYVRSTTGIVWERNISSDALFPIARYRTRGSRRGNARGPY